MRNALRTHVVSIAASTCICRSRGEFRRGSCRGAGWVELMLLPDGSRNASFCGRLHCVIYVPTLIECGCRPLHRYHFYPIHPRFYAHLEIRSRLAWFVGERSEALSGERSGTSLTAAVPSPDGDHLQSLTIRCPRSPCSPAERSFSHVVFAPS